MKFGYETRLDDLVEPAFRLCQRKRSYRVTKWRNMALCAVGCAMLALLGFKSSENVSLPVAVVVGAAWGAFLIHFSYAGSVRRQIRRYLSGEIGSSLPFATDYEVDAEKIICTSRGSRIGFDLIQLEAVTEDGKWLELSFGEKGLFVIPLRAFVDAEEKAAFLTTIGRGE